MDIMQKPQDAETRAARASKNADPLGANSEIGRKLKQYYDDLVSESVPDRFQDLLRQLEDREHPAAEPATASDGE